MNLLELGHVLLGHGVEREALQVVRTLPKLDVGALDYRVSDDVVERPGHSLALLQRAAIPAGVQSCAMMVLDSSVKH